MVGPEFCQRFHQDVSVAEVGQRAIDRTQRSLIAAEPAAVVIFYKPQDGADFLDAFSRFVNWLVARRSSLLKFAARRLDLFSHQTPQPVRN
jgi:hypothetical protein